MIVKFPMTGPVPGNRRRGFDTAGQEAHPGDMKLNVRHLRRRSHAGQLLAGRRASERPGTSVGISRSAPFPIFARRGSLRTLLSSHQYMFFTAAIAGGKRTVAESEIDQWWWPTPYVRRPDRRGPTPPMDFEPVICSVSKYAAVLPGPMRYSISAGDAATVDQRMVEFDALNVIAA